MKQIDELTKRLYTTNNRYQEMIRSFRCEMTNCDTFDIRRHPMWPKWLQQKDRLGGLSVVANYKIDFERLLVFKKPVLILTLTSTIEPNITVNKLLSHEFINARTENLPGDHIAIYQNPERFVRILKAFLRDTGSGN